MASRFKKEAAIAKLVASNAAMDNSRDATQMLIARELGLR